MTSKTPLILNGKLFQVTEESSDGKIKAKCCVCPDSKPALSGSKKATSNFLLHLKRKHPAEATEFEKSKKGRFSERENTQKYANNYISILQVEKGYPRCCFKSNC